MARFNVDDKALDGLTQSFLKGDARTKKAVPKMLEAGAQVLVEAQRAEALHFNRSGRSTGSLAASIGTGKTKTSTTGMSIEVYPKGNDGKGVRNAFKGAILNYGRKVYKPISANPWVTRSIESASDGIHQAMLDVWEQSNE